ncbi:MAG: MFS transporter [Solirubrobacteraceae bacterium]
MSTNAMADSTSASPRAAARLPLASLLALAAAGFLTMLTETVPAGLLPSIGDGLGVSDGRAGQLLTVYAVGSVLGAIPLTALTRGLPRRTVLLATIVVIGAVNGVTAASPSYEATAALRLAGGLAAGVQWAMIAGYAMRLVDDRLKGRALAISMAGVPMALAFGVPLGAGLGDLLGWRLVFAIIAVAALAVGVWVRWQVAPFAGERAGQRTSVRRVLAQRALVVVLAGAFAFELGHMTLYTYIAPFLGRAGLGGNVGAVLLVFGIAAILGLWAAGALADRHLRVVLLGTLGLFSACMLSLGAAGTSAPAAIVAIAFWGVALGAAPTAFQAICATVARRASDVAQSLLVTALNAGMAAGSAAGGLALGTGGPATLPWVSFAIFAAALLLLICARTGAAVRPSAPPHRHPIGPQEARVHD